RQYPVPGGGLAGEDSGGSGVDRVASVQLSRDLVWVVHVGVACGPGGSAINQIQQGDGDIDPGCDGCEVPIRVVMTGRGAAEQHVRQEVGTELIGASVHSSTSGCLVSAGFGVCFGH